MILKHPHPSLRQVADPVGVVTEDVRRLADQMIGLMNDHDGAGLAAPQIGQPIQLIVMKAAEGDIALINPVITERKGSEKLEEGCLSFPGLYRRVRRPSKVRADYYDLNGEFHSRLFSRQESRILHHEIDHLKGKLFIDYH